MATAVRQDDYPRKVAYEAASDTASDQLVAIGAGGLMGIVMADIAAGEVGAAQIDGTIEYAKAGDVVAQGVILYYDSGNDRLTTADGGGANDRVGIAARSYGAGAATAQVILNA